MDNDSQAKLAALLQQYPDKTEFLNALVKAMFEGHPGLFVEVMKKLYP